MTGKMMEYGLREGWKGELDQEVTDGNRCLTR
jgi:hypothetical protein